MPQSPTLLHQHLIELSQYQGHDASSFAQSLCLSWQDAGWQALKAELLQNPKSFPSSAELSSFLSLPQNSSLFAFHLAYTSYLQSVHWAPDSALSSNFEERSNVAKKEWEAMDRLWDATARVWSERDGGWAGKALVKVGEGLLHLAFRSSQISQDKRSNAPSNSVDKIRRMFQASAVSNEYTLTASSSHPPSLLKGDPVFALGNLCWRVYSQLKTYRLLDTLSQTYSALKPNVWARLDGNGTRMKERMGWWFWSGKGRLGKGQVREAMECFQKALDLCPVGSRNFRAIFIPLLTCQIILGRRPSSLFLSALSLPPSFLAKFTPLIKAINLGDRKGYYNHLNTEGEWFRKRGLWLVLREKGEVLLWRNLLKRTYAIWSVENPSASLRSATCPTEVFLKAVKWSYSQTGEGEDVGLEDVLAILASLIDQSYIKGQISFGQKTLVMAKREDDPLAGFPPISSIQPRRIAV